MPNELIYEIARQIAEQVNRRIDIPFLSEEEEQAILQLLALKVVEILFLLRKQKDKPPVK